MLNKNIKTQSFLEKSDNSSIDSKIIQKTKTLKSHKALEKKIVKAQKEEGCIKKNVLMSDYHKINLLKLLADGKIEQFFTYIDEKGVDINAPLNDKGFRLIEMLLYEDFSAAVRLYELGAKINFADRNLLLQSARMGIEPFSFLLEAGNFDLSDNKICREIFLRASLYGKSECINLLMDQGIDPRKIFSYNENPLDQITRSSKTNPDILKIYTDMGFKIKKEHFKNAIKGGNIDALKFLIENGNVRVQKLDIEGANLLDYAVSAPSTGVDMLKFLEKQGFTLKDYHLEIAKFNLEYGDVVDKEYKTEDGGKVRFMHSYFPNSKEVYEYIEKSLKNSPK